MLVGQGTFKGDHGGLADTDFNIIIRRYYTSLELLQLKIPKPKFPSRAQTDLLFGISKSVWN